MTDNGFCLIFYSSGITDLPTDKLIPFPISKVSHMGLKVFLLMSDPSGAADVSCRAQEIKMRPEKSVFSGLMNSCRGAAVGMDYEIQTERTNLQTDLCQYLASFFVQLLVESKQFLQGIFQLNHHKSWSQVTIDKYVTEGRKQTNSNTMKDEAHPSLRTSISIKTDYSPELQVVWTNECMPVQLTHCH